MPSHPMGESPSIGGCHPNRRCHPIGDVILLSDTTSTGGCDPNGGVSPYWGGRHLHWGMSTTSGDATPPRDVTLWGDPILLGDVTLWGDPILLGDVTLWGGRPPASSPPMGRSSIPTAGRGRSSTRSPTALKLSPELQEGGTEPGGGGGGIGPWWGGYGAGTAVGVAPPPAVPCAGRDGDSGGGGPG